MNKRPTKRQFEKYKKTLRRFERQANAYKGWRTRRANERKRSAAARKGWRTRRANERKRKKVSEFQHIILRKQTPAGKGRNGWSRASVEVSIQAPQGLTNAQIKQIADAIAHQQDLPFGATAEAIEWQVGQRAKTYPYLKDAQSGFDRFGILSWKLTN